MYTSGSYLYGQQGNNNTVNNTTLTAIPGLTNIVKLETGYSTGYALEENGRLMSWGNSYGGATGNNVGTGSANTPVQVQLIGDYKVEHYQQNVTGTGYTLSETESLVGVFPNVVTATPKAYTGFTQNTAHASRVPSGTLNAEGTLVLRLYYDRNNHTVTYKDWNNATLKTETVRYGGNATPPTSPTRVGYTYTGWRSSSIYITANRTITAQYTANTNTPYKVEHYKENQNDDEYTLFETTNHTGTTDTTATVAPKVYANYTQNTTHPSRIVSGNIDGDGSRVLKLYYILDRYNISFTDKNGNTINSQTIKHGNNSTLPDAPVIPGYDFNGWIEKP